MSILKRLDWSKAVGAAVRHGATALGGFLIAKGVSEETTAQVVGALLAVGAYLASLKEKNDR